MTLHYGGENTTVWHGDCIEVMRSMNDNSVDSIVTDPPYDLKGKSGKGGFMGKEWDGTGVAFDPETWREALRVLKPGGHLLAFGGTRTWHRLAVAVEDAGFEIRDSIAWMYGSGFPKSHDVSKAIDKAAGAEREVVGRRKKTNNTVTSRQHHGETIDGRATDGRDMQNAKDYQARGGYNLTAPATPAAEQWQGWGTALKPAFEPIVMARKPLIGTVAQNVQTHGTGALNIDATRIPHGDEVDLEAKQRQQVGHDTGWRLGKHLVGTEISMYKPGGRWPANVALDEDMAEVLDRQSGNVKTGAVKPYTRAADSSPMFAVGQDLTFTQEASSGGASRFFYVAKAPKRERPVVDGTAHPTVKPLALMRWLIRLVTPEGGVVLDPFAGSGTTLEAAALEGFQSIGIEREAEYLPLIQARIERAA